MTSGFVRDQKLEKHIGNGKQMGCMGGFLQIFDRHQVKRINSAKRPPPSPLPGPEPERCTNSPASGNQSPPPENTQSKMPLPSLSSFEFKEGTRSSWKFSREVPRLSLDSRAIADANRREIHTNPSTNPGDGAESDGDKQWRATSVIARLMGLEPFPNSELEPLKKAELRRSASEPRFSRDFCLFESNNLQLKQQQSKTLGNISGDAVASAIDNHLSNGRATDPKAFLVRNGKTECAKVPIRLTRIGQNKSFYDSADFFPEPKHSVSICGEIERRLKLRGIDEPSKDLETLKQILEALQLKGLLHSKKSTAPINQRNFVFDGRVSANESPIVLMKPMRSSGSLNQIGRTGSETLPSSFRSSPRIRGNNETLPSASPRSDRPEIDLNLRTQSQARARNLSSPTRRDSSVRCPNRIRVLANTETQTKVNHGVDPRRVPQVHSPKVSSRRDTREQQLTGSSARMRKGPSSNEVVIGGLGDESSTSSQTDTDRCKKEHKEGRNLLKGCDKLLSSIAEIAAATELSPVSVLDSSLYKDESSCSPSPVMKRYIDYKGQPAELDDIWNAAMCCSEAKSKEASEDCDFAYVSEILRMCNYPQEEDSDLFLLLEKQQCLKGNDTSKVSTLRRRLIFDTIHEILNRNQRLPPWKAASWVEETPLLQRIWSEFRRIREREESEDLFEVICAVLRKDMAVDGMNDWGECPIEVGDVVLDMERLIFKDLVGETIRNLASFAGKYSRVSAYRRKLVFF